MNWAIASSHLTSFLVSKILDVQVTPTQFHIFVCKSCVPKGNEPYAPGIGAFKWRHLSLPSAMGSQERGVKTHIGTVLESYRSQGTLVWRIFEACCNSIFTGDWTCGASIFSATQRDWKLHIIDVASLLKKWIDLRVRIRSTSVKTTVEAPFAMLDAAFKREYRHGSESIRRV